MIVRKHLDPVIVLRVAWKRVLILLIVSVSVTFTYHYFDNEDLAIDSLPASVLGVALAILIGFRINSAYERWWEARRLWGAVVNDSRTVARQALSFFGYSRLQNNESEETEQEKKKFLYRQIAFVYALKNHLRKQSQHQEFQSYLSDPEFYKLTQYTQHIPNAILLLHADHLRQLIQQGVIEDLRHMQIDSTLSSLSDSMGGCERIKNTVFPRQYSYYTTIFIAIYSYLLPFVFVSKSGWATVPFTVIIGFIFFALDTIASGIENPFENSYNDTPMSSICRTIEINLKQMLHESEIPKTVEPIHGFLY